jgi:hypothetical protein
MTLRVAQREDYWEKQDFLGGNIERMDEITQNTLPVTRWTVALFTERFSCYSTKFYWQSWLGVCRKPSDESAMISKKKSNETGSNRPKYWFSTERLSEPERIEPQQNGRAEFSLLQDRLTVEYNLLLQRLQQAANCF